MLADRVLLPQPIAVCITANLAANVAVGSDFGHSAMTAPGSALPESGHGWTIYEYTP
jgi:hypothetical protein